MAFRIKALDPRLFADLFDLPDPALAARRAVRMTADGPGFPCRVSLAEAQSGEEVLLVNHQHQPELSPYQASHAVFIRRGAPRAHPSMNEVPDVLASRVLSLRAFDAAAMIVAADLIDGRHLGVGLDTLLDLPATAYVHIHYAKFGCYAARADRE